MPTPVVEVHGARVVGGDVESSLAQPAASERVEGGEQQSPADPASALPFVHREDVDESDATAQASAQDEAHDNFAASFDKRQ